MKLPSKLGLFMDRLSLRQQLYSAFLVLLLLTGALGAASLFGLGRVNGAVDALANKWLVGLMELTNARGEVMLAREFEIKYSKTGDKSYQAEYRDKMAESDKAVDALLAGYTAAVRSDAERTALAKLNQGWAKYRDAQQRVVAAGVKNQQEAADLADGASSMLFDEVVSDVNALITFNQEGGKAAADEAETVYAQARAATAGVLAAAVLLGMVLTLVITRRLSRLLGGEPHAAVAVARAVAQGDLNSPIVVRAGDTTSLLAWLQTMQRALAETVSHVRKGSESVSTASAEIAQGNQDLSARTEQQASALQQTAATMDELGATVRNNADNARQASQLAAGASAVAERGGAVVGEVVETMRGINDSSRRIADIISTIDGIAFQTNILALNAAVEAARAGEQGRGFAVVAGEVRSLAQRSAEAAREIKALITASVERVEHGTTLVGRAGATMSEIVGAIQRVNDIVGEISSASGEQSVGVSQVGQAVTALDKSTQQNAALVEQSAAAAESLKEQAGLLVQAVAVFKLADGGWAAPTAPARPVVMPVRAPAVVVARTKPQASTVKPVPSVPRAVPATKPAASAAATTADDDDWQSF